MFDLGDVGVSNQGGGEGEDLEACSPSLPGKFLKKWCQEIEFGGI